MKCTIRVQKKKELKEQHTCANLVRAAEHDAYPWCRNLKIQTFSRIVLVAWSVQSLWTNI